MTALAYMSRTAQPQPIEAPTAQGLLDVADSMGALWVVIGGRLVGWTICGKWAEVRI